MNISLSPAAADQLHFELDGRYLRIAFTTGCGGSGYRQPCDRTTFTVVLPVHESL